MIQRNFDLHLHAGKSNPLVINANQYDSGERWIFTLYNHGQVFTPTTGGDFGCVCRIKQDSANIFEFNSNRTSVTSSATFNVYAR